MPPAGGYTFRPRTCSPGTWSTQASPRHAGIVHGLAMTHWAPVLLQPQLTTGTSPVAELIGREHSDRYGIEHRGVVDLGIRGLWFDSMTAACVLLKDRLNGEISRIDALGNRRRTITQHRCTHAEFLHQRPRRAVSYPQSMGQRYIAMCWLVATSAQLHGRSSTTEE